MSSRPRKSTRLAGLGLVVVLALGAADAASLAAGPNGRVTLTRWTLRRDPHDVGRSLGWSRGDFTGMRVSVPNVVNPTPVSGDGAMANYEGSVAWYRTTFTARAAGTYAVDFGSANYLAQVWLDGRRLGAHTGFYLPFEFRRVLASGSHTLVVRVDWRDPLAQTHAGFHRTWFNFGGLDGAVTVRAIGASELSDPTIATTLAPRTAQPATVRIGVDVRNDGPTRSLAPAGELRRGEQAIPLSFASHTVPAGKTVRMSTSVAIADPALWSPSGPRLYDLTLRVGAECSFAARVGLRQLTWSAGHMYLNGQPLTLHGASIQAEAPGRGDALGVGEQEQLVAELKAVGANATRSQHPLDPGLLERLDAAGILVWQGVGPDDPSGDWTGRTPVLARRAREDVRTTVRQDALHPSIIAWSLTNELARNGHPGGQARYVEAMADWLHAYDPGRLVAVGIWGAHPPRRAGPLYRNVDAVAETDYSGWYEGVHDTPRQLDALIQRRLALMHRTFAGKVQVIGEFGAEADALNPAHQPGGYAFQARLLAQHITLYEHDPQLSGMLVWVLRDFALTPRFDGGSIRRELPHIKLRDGIDEKGLFDYAGRPRPAARVVAGLFKAAPP